MTANHRLGTVTAVDTTAVTADVTVDGTTVTAAVLCQMPQLTQTVWVELRGRFQQDWVITGIQDPPTARAFNLSRYAVGRVATGVVNAAYDYFGTPPNTAWSTGSTTGSPLVSRLTITTTCHLDMWLQLNANGTIELLFWAGGTTAYRQDYPATQQGGSVYGQAVQWSGLALAGEFFDFNYRNTSGATVNYTSRSWFTFADAYAVVAQT